MVDSVREQLLASHEEFRRLAQEHHQHCQRLHSLIEKRYLTEDEKLEEVRIKKFTHACILTSSLKYLYLLFFFFCCPAGEALLFVPPK